MKLLNIVITTINDISQHYDILIGLLAVVFTVYIPLGIRAFSSFGEDKKEGYSDIDRAIIKKKHFNVKRIILLLIVDIASILLITSSISIYANILGIITYCVVTYLILKDILHLNSWITDSKKQHTDRCEFLEQDNTNQYRFSIFENEIEDINESIEYIKIAFDKINDYLSNQDYLTAGQILVYLNKNIQKQNTRVIFYTENSVLMSCANLIYHDYQTKFTKDKNIRLGQQKFSSAMRDIFEKLFLLLPTSEGYYIPFVRNDVIGKNEYPIDFIEHYDIFILQHILQEKRLIEDKGFCEHISKVYQLEMSTDIDREFYSYILRQIRNHKKGDYLQDVENIIHYVFSDVDVVSFSLYLKYLLAPTKDAKKIIENSPQFGRYPRTIWNDIGTSTEEVGKDSRKNILSATSAIVGSSFFKNAINTNNINQILKDIRNYIKKIPKDDRYYAHQYLSAFEAMKQYIEEK